MTRPCKDRPVELRLWFAVMDATRWFPGANRNDSWATRVYLYAVGKAGQCVEWGDGADCSGGTGVEPF